MIHIGVTGHRAIASPELIYGGILEVLSRISSIYPNDEFAIVSSLAAGADCLFSKAAIDNFHSKLMVRLPLSVFEYRNDFLIPDQLDLFNELLNKASVVTEEEAVGSREDAYFLAGKYVVDHCDILVAIWDGQAAQGRGGTGDIVCLARECGRPLGWIQANNHKPGLINQFDLADKQGQVIYERFPK